jgi:hypothetical protein
MQKKKDYNPSDYKPKKETKKPKAKSKGGFLRTFLMVIGIIAIVIIILIIGAVIALILIKPYGLDITGVINPPDSSQPIYDHPLLSPDQEKTLQTFGIDPATVPTSISPVQEQCAVSAIGQSRVDQIKAGATPSITDYLKAKDCF